MSTPGGCVDLRDSSPIAAAWRETKEETGTVEGLRFVAAETFVAYAIEGERIQTTAVLFSASRRYVPQTVELDTIGRWDWWSTAKSIRDEYTRTAHRRIDGMTPLTILCLARFGL